MVPQLASPMIKEKNENLQPDPKMNNNFSVSW